jgi:hypothetical protein
MIDRRQLAEGARQIHRADDRAVAGCGRQLS